MSGLGSGGENSTDDGDCYSPYDSYDYTIVAAISSTMGALSFLACVFMMFIILLYKKYLVFTQRLILYLAITSAVTAFVTILHIVEREGPNWLCVTAAYIDQTASWGVLIAVTCITINLSLVIFHRNTERLEFVYIAFIFGFPLLFTWIPFINDAYGKAGAWCWIRAEKDCERWTYGSVLLLIMWYIPLYILFAIVTVIYIIVLVKLRRDRHKWVGQYDPTAEKLQKKMQKQVRPLLWFPLIYLLIYIIPLINRIKGAASDDPVLALWILTALLYPSQGIFVMVVFLLDPDTFKRLRWSVFKATVMQLWRKDVQEYQVGVVKSDSISQKSRKEKESEKFVETEATIEGVEPDLLRKLSADSTDQ